MRPVTERRYTISEVSKITGLSKHTLRYYARINLFRPNYVEPSNGYRYYTYDQFWQIDIITCCRNINISIPEIREILQSEDNEKVVRLIEAHREEALAKSRYYQRIADDIQWYSNQHEAMNDTACYSEVEVKELPERTVLYGKNEDDVKAYHLKLQEAVCRNSGHNNVFRRNYGFIINAAEMKNNNFKKECEYLMFPDEQSYIQNPEYIMTLPAGKYACCMVKVVNENADFGILNGWLRDRGIEPSYVIADEACLQLFEYLEHGYLCEVKVLLPD